MKKLTEGNAKALSIESHKMAHSVLTMKKAHDDLKKAIAIYMDIVTKNAEVVLLAEQNIQDLMKGVGDE